MADAAAAVEGAGSILAERFAEDADLIGELRDAMWSRGRLESRVRAGKQEAGAKFSDYFDFAEAFTRLPSHRILALFRGEKEEILDLSFAPEVAAAPVGRQDGPSWYELRVARHFAISDRGRPADRWLMDTVRGRGARASCPVWPPTFEPA